MAAAYTEAAATAAREVLLAGRAWASTAHPAVVALVVVAALLTLAAAAQGVKEARYSYIPGPPGYPLLGHMPYLLSEPWLRFAEFAAKYGPVYRLWVFGKLFVVVTDPELVKQIFVTRRAHFPKDKWTYKYFTCVGWGRGWGWGRGDGSPPPPWHFYPTKPPGVNNSCPLQRPSPLPHSPTPAPPHPHPHPRPPRSDILGNGVVTSEGAAWKHKRQLLNPAFNFAALERLQTSVFDQATARLVCVWLKDMGGGGTCSCSVPSHLGHTFGSC